MGIGTPLQTWIGLMIVWVLPATEAQTTGGTTTPWPGYDNRCYCPGDPALATNGQLFQALSKLKQSADILGQDGFSPLQKYYTPEVLDPGVPPVGDLAKMFPTKSQSSLISLTQDTLLLTLGITTTTTTTPAPSTQPPPAQSQTTAQASTAAASTAAASTATASAAQTTKATSASTAAAGRKKRDVDSVEQSLGDSGASARMKREAVSSTPASTGTPELGALNMLIPRAIMLGIQPNGTAPRYDPAISFTCACPAPTFRLRKNFTLSNYQWKDTFKDPASGDFAKEKGIREDQLNSLVSKNLEVMLAGLGSITVLSISLAPTTGAAVSATSVGSSVVYTTDITFASQYNASIVAALDNVFTAPAAATGLTAAPAANATCPTSSLPATYPAGSSPYLTLFANNSANEVAPGQTASGLFAYYGCTSGTLNATFDPDQDGRTGVQCMNGVWLISPATMPTASDCKEDIVCKVADIATQISANQYNRPSISHVSPQQFLFLTCKDPDWYIVDAREPQPSIFKLYCDDTGKFVPWLTNGTGSQGPNNTWMSCKVPNYCTVFPSPPIITTTPVPSSTTSTASLITSSPASSTTTLPPTSQLVKANPAVTRVRMYNAYEYKCVDPTMVAANDSTFKLVCPPTGVYNASTISWARCRPASACNGTIPKAPFYTNLISFNTTPVKEFDEVVYTCLGDGYSLPGGAQNFKVKCGSSNNFILPTRWPICQTTVKPRCYCLGDPEVTPVTCNETLSQGRCPAAKILDKSCRNSSKIMYYQSTDLVPLKDRCGTTDMGNPTEDSMCYCQQRTEEGVKDAFWLQFMVISHLWDSAMGFTDTQIFKSLQYIIQKNFDEMIFGESDITSKGFVRSLVYKLFMAQSLKCRVPPSPPNNTLYIPVNASDADFYLGDLFYFKCPRSYYLKSKNWDGIFGFQCAPDRANKRGYYLTPVNDTWEVCVPNPFYAPGCSQALDWPVPPKSSPLTLAPLANPDPIPVGGSLKFVCPLVTNPPVSKPNQRQVTPFGPVFQINCTGDGMMKPPAKWPTCSPPKPCFAISAPPVDTVATQGLSKTYNDIYEFEVFNLSCTDTVKYVPGTENFPVACTYNPNRLATNSSWAVPTVWPTCQYKPWLTCNPLTELVIPDWTGLQVASAAVVMVGSSTSLQCWNETLEVGDSKTFDVPCLPGGNYQTISNSSWPLCQWPTCKASTLPPSSVTGVLRPTVMTDTPVGGFLQYACPGGNVTDNSRFLVVLCNGNPAGAGGVYSLPTTWPACRRPFNCTARNYNTPPPPSSGLNCTPMVLPEFTDLICTCRNTSLVPDSTMMPSCGRLGIWTYPTVWPQCVLPPTPPVTNTTTNTTTTNNTTNNNNTTTKATTSANTTPAANTTGSTAAASGATTATGASTVSGVTTTSMPTNTTASATTASSSKGTSSSPAPGRRKREAAAASVEADHGWVRNQRVLRWSDEAGSFVEHDPHEWHRSKRQASVSDNYVQVSMEVQFAQDRKVTKMQVADFTETIRDLLIDRDGTFYNESHPLYLKLETPPGNGLDCRDCVKVMPMVETCGNDLLNMMPAGYTSSKPIVNILDPQTGKTKDIYQVMVGGSVEVFCSSYWKKPKKDIWDDDRTDGYLTATCLFNKQFSLPYDTTQWGSCLAKCSKKKPESDELSDPALRLVLDPKYSEKIDRELWEGDDLNYICFNSSLVINNNPDMSYVRYLCQPTGKYNTPAGAASGNRWPICTIKPVRKEIKEAIRLVLTKFDKNYIFRDGLYGGLSPSDLIPQSTALANVLSITLPAAAIMLIILLVICFCTTADSVLCRICDPALSKAEKEALSSKEDPELGAPIPVEVLMLQEAPYPGNVPLLEDPVTDPPESDAPPEEPDIQDNPEPEEQAVQQEEEEEPQEEQEEEEPQEEEEEEEAEDE